MLHCMYFGIFFLLTRVVVLDKITDYVLFLSKLLVTASVGKFDILVLSLLFSISYPERLLKDILCSPFIKKTTVL